MSAANHTPSATEIEREIANTRLRLSRNLAILDREYALRNLFVHAVRYAESESEGLNLNDAVKRNAVPLGLIGVGMLWLTMADRDIGLGRQLATIFRQLQKLGAELPALFQPKRKSPDQNR